jgi:hypothetical protein
MKQISETDPLVGSLRLWLDCVVKGVARAPRGRIWNPELSKLRLDEGLTETCRACCGSNLPGFTRPLPPANDTSVKPTM